MKRYDLVLRQKNKTAQCLPADLDDKITHFHQFIIKNQQKNGFKLSCIGSMDETPMTFDITGNQIVTQRGEETILIKTTGHEKSKFTLVL